MKKGIKFFTYFIIFSFIFITFFSIIFTNNISAVVGSYDFGFENTTAGINITNGFPVGSDNIFTSQRNGGFSTNFATSSESVRTGSRSFKLTNSIGWFNATYSKSKYLTNFSMWWEWQSFEPNKCQFTFYNYTLGVSYPLIDIKYNGGAYDDWEYANEVGTWIDIDSSIVGYTYIKIYFNIVNTNGDVYYFVDSTGISGVSRNPSYIEDGYRIDRIKIDTDGNGQLNYIDDIEWKLSDYYGEGEEGEGEGQCWEELENYIPTGVDNAQNIMQIIGKNLLHTYNIYTVGTLRAVSICIDNYQYQQIYNLTDYWCSILGNDIKSADCFQPMFPNWRVIWYCDYELPDLSYYQFPIMPYAQFFCNKQISGFYNTYWLVAISNTDLDNDGDTVFFWDTNIWITPQYQVDYDLGVSYWLEQEYEPPTPDINQTDTIFMSGYDFSNETGYYYYMDNPNGMVIGYTQESQAYHYSIHLEKNDSASMDDEWYGVPYPSGEVYFPAGSKHDFHSPDNDKTIGKYKFYLDRSDELLDGENVTAYFIDRTPLTPSPYPSDFYIETRPSTTEPYKSYTIFYIYNHTDDLNGSIGIFSDIDDRNIFDNAYQTFPITSLIDDTGRTILFTTSISTSTEYLTMFVNNNEIYIPVEFCNHYIENPTVYKNEIFVSQLTLEINRNNPENRDVSIFGTHTFPTSDVWIYINNEKYRNIQYQQSFSEQFIPRTGGQYRISLMVMEDTTPVELDYVIFSVSVYEGITPPTPPIFDIVVPTPYNYFAGIFVIILLTLSPLAVVGFMSKSTGRDFNFSSIPQILYLIMTIVGFVITIIFEWFPVWTVAVLVVMCVVIIAILWLQKKNVSEG